MIVDDEPNVVNGLVEHISWTELGLSVEMTANDGEEALSKIRERQPDIVITDVYMPKMDGLTLIRHLREEFPHIYIVIHSGYDEFENARIAMRYGVQHFLLKPSIVSEISAVMSEIVQEMDVDEKRHSLIQRFEEQQQSYMKFVKDTFIRELLVTRYQAEDIPAEKLELLQLSGDTRVIAASLALLRPPYLTKAKEREWQLMKFGSGNIIREIIEEHDCEQGLDIHVVDYSDSMFVIVFIAKQPELDLVAISKQVTEQMIDNILLYLKLSLSVGIGEVKQGLHELINSYLESQQALEAADYQAINRAFTYREVQDTETAADYQYPFDMLKEIYEALENRELTPILQSWRKFEAGLLSDNRLPLFITQNLCMSFIGILTMTGAPQEDDMNKDMQQMSEWFKAIYAQTSTKELCNWMDGWIDEWVKHSQEAWSGKKSHKLVQQVKQYVRDHYDEEISLTEIAENLYVNRNYLSQLFKKVTGETFVTYLNKFRIEKAKEKMRERHYLISEISEMVGYQNSTYFSQVFKSITGKSPSEFYK